MNRLNIKEIYELPPDALVAEEAMKYLCMYYFEFWEWFEQGRIPAYRHGDMLLFRERDLNMIIELGLCDFEPF